MVTNAFPLSKQIFTIKEANLFRLGFGFFTFAISKHCIKQLCNSALEAPHNCAFVEVKEICITKINLEGKLCRNFLYITKTITFWPPADIKKSSFQQSG